MRRVPASLLLIASLAVATGCGSARSTAPVPPPRVSRDLAVTATDSLGTPLTDLRVRATSLTDSAGLARVQVAYTGADGVARFRLEEGPWAFTASAGGSPEQVLGGTAQVPGDERPVGDSVHVALAARTASRVTGRVRLRREADHSGTLVGLGVAAGYTLTDAAGDFALDGVPPGRWAVTAYHGGYELRAWWITVDAPGSFVALPEDSLREGDDAPSDPPSHSAARPAWATPALAPRH